MRRAQTRQPAGDRPGSLRFPDPQPDGERERAPHAELAFEPDLASHQLDQPPRDAEAQSGPAVAAGGRHVGLRERLEQPLGLLARHADAGVAHGEPACISRRPLQDLGVT